MKSPHLLIQALEYSPVPIMITDVEGNIEYINPRFTELTGYEWIEVRGKNPRFLSAGKTPRQVYEHLWKTILSGCPWQGELCNKKKDGSLFWEVISVAPIKNETGLTTHFVAVWQDVTELALKEKRFEYESHTDELTGLYSRRYILSELAIELERARRYERTLSALMIDVDNFKAINDEHGHLIGDQVLKTFARILRTSIRKVDLAGRYGGDEFLLILPESGVKQAKFVAERIQSNLKIYQTEILADFAPLTASFGLMAFDHFENITSTFFMEKIDRALLEAKRAGKNKIVVAK